MKIGSIWRFNVSHNLYINFCAGKTSKERNFHLNSRAFHPPAAAFTTSDPFLASTDWTMHHLCFFSWFNVDPIPNTYVYIHAIQFEFKLFKKFNGKGHWEMGHWEVEIVGEGKKRFSLGKIVSGSRPIWGSPRWGAVNTPTTLPVLRCTIYLWSDVCSDVLYLYSDVILRSRKGTIASNSHSGAGEWKGKGGPMSQKQS